MSDRFGRIIVQTKPPICKRLMACTSGRRRGSERLGPTTCSKHHGGMDEQVVVVGNATRETYQTRMNWNEMSLIWVWIALFETKKLWVGKPMGFQLRAVKKWGASLGRVSTLETSRNRYAGGRSWFWAQVFYSIAFLILSVFFDAMWHVLWICEFDSLGVWVLRSFSTDKSSSSNGGVWVMC